MREAADPVPCPVCDRDGERIMPTTFTAFTFREGYPRRLPDKGTYWHLGKEVKSRIKGPARPFEHPELARPKAPPRGAKGEREGGRPGGAGEKRKAYGGGHRPRRDGVRGPHR